MMDDVKAAILVFITGMVVGFLVGSAASSGVINSDCAKYGQYDTEKYKMTCEAIK